VRLALNAFQIALDDEDGTPEVPDDVTCRGIRVFGTIVVHPTTQALQEVSFIAAVDGQKRLDLSVVPL
jgi:hypothetical protein